MIKATRLLLTDVYSRFSFVLSIFLTIFLAK